MIDANSQPIRSRQQMSERVARYLAGLEGGPLPGFLGKPNLNAVAETIDLPYSALRHDETARDLIAAHAKDHGVWESRPRRHGQTRIALQEYAKQKRKTGESIPAYPGRPSIPDYRVVAKDLGIDYEQEWLGRVDALRLVQREFAGIPLGEPVRTTADEWAARSVSRAQFRAFDAALTAMEASRTSLPESLLKPGTPDFEAIGALFDVPPIRLTQTTQYRARLLRAIDIVGLKRRSFKLGRVDFRLSYDDLAQEVARRRKEDTRATRTSAQAISNGTSALRTLRKALGRSEDEDCTEDLGKRLNESLKAAEERCLTPNTKKKLRTELRRIQKYYVELERQACHPTTFSEAMNTLIEQSGLSFLAIERQTGCRAEALRNWVRSNCRPSPENRHYLKKLEKFFGLDTDALTRFFGQDAAPALSKRSVEAAAQMEKVDGRCLPHLPANFAERSVDECRKIVTFVTDCILKQSREEHYLERISDWDDFQLKLDNWPESLQTEWMEVCEMKQTALLPFDVRRRPGSVWSEGGTQVMLSRLEGYFGYLILPAKRGGQGLSRSSLSLLLLVEPELFRSYIKWRQKRRSGILVRWDSDTATSFAGLLDPEFGALAQLPGASRRVAAIPDVISDERRNQLESKWLNCCGSAAGSYKKLAAEIDAHAEVSRDPFEPILGLVDSDNPRQMYYETILGMENDYPDQGLCPIPFHAHRRDCVLMRLALITALRRKNMAELTYRPDGKGSLRYLDGLWMIVIPRKRFKNSRSSFFGSITSKNDYVRIIPDQDGLYLLLDKYISESRPYLIRNCRTDSLLITSRSDKCSVSAYSQIFRNITQEYFAYNPYKGTGIPGVMPHGPHAIRHVVATDIIKKTGRLELAADAIQDSVSVVREHYGRFLTKDKHRLLEEYYAKEALQASVSGQSGVELEHRIKELEVQISIAKEQLKRQKA